MKIFICIFFCPTTYNSSSNNVFDDQKPFREKVSGLPKAFIMDISPLPEVLGGVGPLLQKGSDPPEAKKGRSPLTIGVKSYIILL